MEKPGTSEGQGGYGRYREVEDTIGQLHDASFVSSDSDSYSLLFSCAN